MGPTDNLTLGSNSDSMSIVPKLHDDRSNWADYKPRVERVLGEKGLWRHVVGTAIVPKPYAVGARVPVLADGITQASNDQVESKLWIMTKGVPCVAHYTVNYLYVAWNQAKKPKNCKGNVGHSKNRYNVKEYPVYPRHRRSVVQHEAQRQ